MSGVRQRQAQSAGQDDKKTSQTKGGGLLTQDDEGGLEIKYVVFILIIVFIASFLAALYCLGLIGDHSVLLQGRDSRQAPQFAPVQGQDGQPSSPLQGEDGLPPLPNPNMMPTQPPVVATGPPKEQIPKPKSDKIIASPSSDHEPPIREKQPIPPAPKGTTLDKPTILWWTEALYPHRDQGAKAEIKCGQSTCISTVHKNLLGDPMTRGIMFYGTDVRSYEMPLPRKPWHEWALLHEESPQNNYLLAHGPMMLLFNHTATFHRSSDYPLTTQNVPSLEYLVERKPVPLEIKNEHRKKGLAPIVYIQSHCDVPSDRDRFVKKLMEYIDIDSYGKCVHNKDLPVELRDPVETMADERFYNLISKYKFNLAFENAICNDYITEKLYRPLYLGSVPITRGSASVRDWTPDNNSAIVSEEFNGPEVLAEHIKFLDENDDEYLKYLEFKNTGVTNMNLIKTVVERPWGVTRHGQISFITGFECHVCEKISERWEVEKAHEADPSKPLLPPTTGRYSNLPCAEPFASIYPLEEAGDVTDIQAWKDDYWFNFDQAMALRYMIEKGYKNSDKVFDVVDKLRRKQNRRH
ncbi:alpha-(1,3)-fucosyltransferase 11-like [Amphiura filiformis]|uniref:alpha-(1,3)-fucosyltransferase 11-like n=1 Tax=Amphiura filiformis TaxID=82378 RepID=UPI003B20D632